MLFIVLTQRTFLSDFNFWAIQRLYIECKPIIHQKLSLFLASVGLPHLLFLAPFAFLLALAFGNPHSDFCHQWLGVQFLTPYIHLLLVQRVILLSNSERLTLFWKYHYLPSLICMNKLLLSNKIISLETIMPHLFAFDILVHIPR